jgi:hypothetical protein
MQTEFTAEEAKLILQGTDEEWASYIRIHIIRTAPHLEPYIAEYPRASYEYARWVIHGRWSPGEPAIIRDPESAYRYAENVLRRRWQVAEPTILASADPHIIGLYAKYVIRGRWPEAEPIIARDPWEAYSYAINVIRGRWPEAEPVIATDPELAAHYAMYAIQDRWPVARGRAVPAGGDPIWDSVRAGRAPAAMARTRGPDR